MSEVAVWPPMSKCAHRHSFRKSVLFAPLGLTIVIFILFHPPEALKICLKWLGDIPGLVTRPWENTEPGSGCVDDAWDQVNNDPLGWRIQNHTHVQGKEDLDYIGWHPLRIDSRELFEVEAIQPGRLGIVQHPHFGAEPVLIKIADAHEATIYRLLYDLGVTPSFLGHVTQSGRVVGFITEIIHLHERPPVVSVSSRRQACLAALRKLHARGIAHGDAHGENCLLREDGTAALIDFELSAETSSRAEFDRDLWVMHHTVLD